MPYAILPVAILVQDPVVVAARQHATEAVTVSVDLLIVNRIRNNCIKY